MCDRSRRPGLRTPGPVRGAGRADHSIRRSAGATAGRAGVTEVEPDDRAARGGSRGDVRRAGGVRAAGRSHVLSVPTARLGKERPLQHQHRQKRSSPWRKASSTRSTRTSNGSTRLRKAPSSGRTRDEGRRGGGWQGACEAGQHRACHPQPGRHDRRAQLVRAGSRQQPPLGNEGGGTRAPPDSQYRVPPLFTDARHGRKRCWRKNSVRVRRETL
jgi:hypothetical protein